MNNFIKWTGSKRLQASWIVDKFPHDINIYYEPFLGSGSVMMELLSRKNINVTKIVASDICEPLIGLWKTVQENPQKLIDSYRDFHKEFIKNRKEVFNAVRKEFNDDKTKYENFLFLTRTCINGLIRFNSKGNFNSTCHLTRDGISPDSLEKIIYDTYEKIKNVDFLVMSYDCIIPNADDFIYFDPPYANTTSNMYYGGIDIDKFYNYINSLTCKWVLSFDGLIDNKSAIDNMCIDYKKLYYAPKSLSTFKKVQNSEKRIVREALYLNYIDKTDIIDFFLIFMKKDGFLWYLKRLLQLQRNVMYVVQGMIKMVLS